MFIEVILLLLVNHNEASYDWVNIICIGCYAVWNGVNKCVAY